jgi:hypothetical protein
MSLVTGPAHLRNALRTLSLSLIVFATALVPAAFANGPYKLGSSNTVTADPTVPRPSTTPCVVALFTDYTFDNNYNLNPYSYTPPESCPGPWAKVVLEVNISVTAGIQFDRTANIWLGGTNIFFGTTAEPSPTLAPYWHVESDLTEYSPLFTIAQQGSIYLGNTVEGQYTSIQSASAQLEFYPLAKGQPAPITANVVLPISGSALGGTVALNSGTSTLAATFSLPTNIENAYLDVYSQGQIDDEFWYTCAPTNVAAELGNNCPNTAFRETEITIDGQPAGVAPVFPWIFTGGFGDPFLWYPIPGVQTLNFTPYRVDLTPFAALLSNGQQHTVSLSVVNADNWFSDTATLLLYLDSGSTSVTGALTQNTLSAAPNPVVTENLNVNGNNVNGTVKVTSNRNFVLSGYVNTSHGKVTTTISEAVNFVNNQSYNMNNVTFLPYVENVTQNSSANTTTTVSSPGQPTVATTRNIEFPVIADYTQLQQSNGDVTDTTKIQQTYDEQQVARQNGVILFTDLLTNAGQHQDTLQFDSSGNFLGNVNQAASQLYNETDSNGTNYLCIITAASNVLTSFLPSCSE